MRHVTGPDGTPDSRTPACREEADVGRRVPPRLSRSGRLPLRPGTPRMTLTARAVAADVLNLARTRKAFAADAIEDTLGSADSASRLSGQDRRFVTQLVF